MFRMACQQFDVAADYLQIPACERDPLKYPKRSLTVAIPIHRDDGCEAKQIRGLFP
jgi:glutamate dehydrogenase (NAD(P)+)